MKSSKNTEQSNLFWLSYANLMTALFFVFILIMSAISVKYFIAQNILKTKEQAKFEAISNLKDQEGKNISIQRLNEILKSELISINNKNLELQKANKALKSKINLLNDSFKQSEEANRTINSLKDENLELKSQIELLKSDLTNKKDTQNSKDELISTQKNLYSEIISEINATKISLQSISDLKSNLILELKKNIKNSADINLKNDKIIIKTSKFFEKGKSDLKSDKKQILKETLNRYFEIIFSNQQIIQNIERIEISGYTDSGGSYIKNLELTQNRANEMLKFINSFINDDNIQKFLVAYGRSYNNPIIKNGNEDKEASRRVEIEIKFSQDSAIKQLEKLLKYK